MLSCLLSSIAFTRDKYDNCEMIEWLGIGEKNGSDDDGEECAGYYNLIFYFHSSRKKWEGIWIHFNLRYHCHLAWYWRYGGDITYVWVILTMETEKSEKNKDFGFFMKNPWHVSYFINSSFFFRMLNNFFKSSTWIFFVAVLVLIMR